MNLLLSFKWDLSFNKFYCQGFLINLFCESRTKNTMNFHRCANYLVSLLFVS